MTKRTSTRLVSAAAAAACALALVAAPAQAKTKTTPCTRTLKISTSAFSAQLALGAKAGFTDNATARTRLTKSLKNAAVRYNTKVKTANGACTRELKRQSIARDASVRHAQSTLDRAVARQRYTAAAVNAQALREDQVYRAFLGWMTEVDSIYGVYDAATNSPSTASARAQFRAQTAAVRATLSARLSVAMATYVSSRSLAGSQKSIALAAAAAESTPQAKSVATLSAWDDYVGAVRAAQQKALNDRASSLPSAKTTLEEAHAEYVAETETNGPVPSGPEPVDSPEATPTP